MTAKKKAAPPQKKRVAKLMRTDISVLRVRLLANYDVAALGLTIRAADNVLEAAASESHPRVVNEWFVDFA
jgi:hypothetical protein